jgi:hypothetical protein
MTTLITILICLLSGSSITSTQRSAGQKAIADENQTAIQIIVNELET